MVAGRLRLPREPFLPETLDAQRDRAARGFFAEPRNVAVADTPRLLRLSQILEYYRSDFLAQAPSLATYVNRYRSSPVPEDCALRFTPYDWTVDRQPRPGRP